MTKTFTKPFTQQLPIDEETISRVSDILRSGRLHRYNTLSDEDSEVSLLEEEYANWQGAKYCLATTSGGQAMQIGMRAAGVGPGEYVLANAYTLAPVPGAIFATGASAVLVDIDDNWHTDINDLRNKAEKSGAKFFMLSHMRGHIADMDAILSVCRDYDITLIEDCAHTMGARWKGIRSGNFGELACFSTQTYKHLNSGEGGFLTTDNPEIAARAVIGSGSYMLYGRHGAVPDEDVFRRVRLNSPNCSARMDNLRAAVLRGQIPRLEENILQWNILYRTLENGLHSIPGIQTVERKQHEEFVGSSIQFQTPGIGKNNIPDFIAACSDRGVDLKWFGHDEPTAFTSRYDSWQYLGPIEVLPSTNRVLSTTCDMRIPLTFDVRDCQEIVDIIADETRKYC